MCGSAVVLRICCIYLKYLWSFGRCPLVCGVLAIITTKYTSPAHLPSLRTNSLFNIDYVIVHFLLAVL